MKKRVILFLPTNSIEDLIEAKRTTKGICSMAICSSEKDLLTKYCANDLVVFNSNNCDIKKILNSLPHFSQINSIEIKNLKDYIYDFLEKDYISVYKQQELLNFVTQNKLPPINSSNIILKNALSIANKFQIKKASYSLLKYACCDLGFCWEKELPTFRVNMNKWWKNNHADQTGNESVLIIVDYILGLFHNHCGATDEKMQKVYDVINKLNRGNYILRVLRDFPLNNM